MPSLTAESIILAAIFVVPGFVALRVHDLLDPPVARTTSHSVLEAFTFSMLNLAVALPLLLYLVSGEEPQKLSVKTAMTVLIAMPIALAASFYWIRRREFMRRFLRHPERSGWDFFFLQERPCFIRFNLKDGKRIGGYYGPRSFVSLNTEQPDIYLEQLWDLDEKGAFIRAFEGSAGGIVRLQECSGVELLEARESG